MVLVDPDAVEADGLRVLELIHVLVVDTVRDLRVEQPTRDVDPDRAFGVREVVRQQGPRHEVEPGELHGLHRTTARGEATEIDIPDQTGRLAVVTGANSGIGLEAARRLALAGAEVVLAVRTVAKGDRPRRTTSRGLRPRQPSASRALDLASLASVEEFAGAMTAEGRPIDLLVNNAGVMAVPKRHTDD